MKARALALAGLLAGTSGAFTTAWAWRASIGIYFDPDCSTCSATVYPWLPSLTLYVNAHLNPPLEEGFQGAEFRIDGMPTDWLMVDVIPNPAAAAAYGNPLTGGCNIGFATCQDAPSDCVNLYTIHILAVTPHTNVALQVRQHTNPSCPTFCCTTLVGCDAPVYTKYCVLEGRAWINGPACTVGVEPGTWGDVKALYK